MFYWIYDIPTKELAILIAGSFVLFYWSGCFLVRPILRQFVRARSGTNAIVGNVLSCHGVFYGLLLGLLAVAAYQNYIQVETNVSEEAVALATLYEDFHAYREPYGQYLRWLLRGYCRHEIKYSSQRNALAVSMSTWYAKLFKMALNSRRPAARSRSMPRLSIPTSYFAWEKCVKIDNSTSSTNPTTGLHRSPYSHSHFPGLSATGLKMV